MTEMDDHETSEASIFARLWETKNGTLSPRLAREIIKLRFSDRDQSRMRELSVKNRSGRLSAEERQVLDNYIKVGDLIAILQSKARKLLKAKTA